MARKVMKYNPAFLDDEELISSFVVRHFEFESVLKTINENVTESNQHILIIGPRGSGKTTLVRRIALEIERDESLRPLWYPLIFAEESYTVVSAGEFWLEALFHISEKTGDKRWVSTYEELVNESDEKKLRERALAQLMDFADSQNKRILLIVENLNMLFDQIPDDDAWALRHTLLNEPRLMLLATAIPELEQIENSGHAMFELFKIQELKPLDKTECSNMWKMITGLESPDNRIRPLEILTGGNPRLLSIISKFGAKLSLKELMEGLIHLVDDHTDYFKSQLDSLAPIERKVFLALAEIWKPATAKEIARVTRIDVNKASSFLNRLVKRGYVRVDSVSRKTKWYDVTERLYNIYYLMRRRGAPSNRVTFFVRFMIEFYPQDHLVEVTRMIAEEACKLSPDLCKDHYSAYEGILNNISTQALREKIIMSTPNDFFESPTISVSIKSFLSGEMFPQEQITKENYEEKTESQEGVSEEISSEEKPNIIAEEINGSVSKGIELGKAGKYEQAIIVFETVINKYKKREEVQIADKVALAYVNKGVALDKMNKPEEEISVYDDLIEQCNEREEVQIAGKVALAYVNKGIKLGKMNRLEEEISVYDDLIERYKDREEVQIVERIALAYVNKGAVLGKMNRPEEAILVCDELIEQCKDRGDVQIAEQVVKAYVNKGVALSIMNRPEEAISVCDDLIEQYKDREEAHIADNVALTYFNKGVALGIMNRPEEAILVYDDLIEQYKDREEVQIVEQVVRARVNKGVVLGKMNRPEEAILVCDELIEQCKDRRDIQIAEQVVRAYLNKGVALSIMNRPEEEMLVYDELIEQYKDREEAQVVEWVSRAYVNKGFALGKMNKTEEEISVYDDLIEQYKDREEAQVVEQIAKAYVKKGVALGMINRLEEGISIYDDLIERYKNRGEVQVVELIAMAYINKGVAFRELGFAKAEEGFYYKAIEHKQDFGIGWQRLIDLYLEKRKDVRGAVQLANDCMNKNPGDHALMNIIAWLFYIHGDKFLFKYAERLIEKALEISPDSTNYHHTLACILAASGKVDESILHAENYMQDAELLEKSIDDAIELFVELAAAGHAKGSVALLEKSSAIKFLEPLHVALKLYIKEDVKAPAEIMEVARDVIEKIKERQEKRSEKTNSELTANNM